MFGLEKEKRELFEFDLEKELRKDPKKIGELSKMAEGKVNEIKAKLRQGADSEDFEKLGFIMQGYSVLLRILTRIKNKKNKE